MRPPTTCPAGFALMVLLSLPRDDERKLAFSGYIEGVLQERDQSAPRPRLGLFASGVWPGDHSAGPSSETSLRLLHRQPRLRLLLWRRCRTSTPILGASELLTQATIRY